MSSPAGGPSLPAGLAPFVPPVGVGHPQHRLPALLSTTSQLAVSSPPIQNTTTNTTFDQWLGWQHPPTFAESMEMLEWQRRVASILNILQPLVITTDGPIAELAWCVPFPRLFLHRYHNVTSPRPFCDKLVNLNKAYERAYTRLLGHGLHPEMADSVARSEVVQIQARLEPDRYSVRIGLHEPTPPSQFVQPLFAAPSTPAVSPLPTLPPAISPAPVISNQSPSCVAATRRASRKENTLTQPCPVRASAA